MRIASLWAPNFAGRLEPQLPPLQTAPMGDDSHTQIEGFHSNFKSGGIAIIALLARENGVQQAVFHTYTSYEVVLCVIGRDNGRT